MVDKPNQSFVVTTGTGASLTPVRQVPTRDRIFHLREPVLISVREHNEGYWSCEAAEFGIHAFGDSEKEAFDSFCEDFSVLWDAIAGSRDDELTEDAMHVKRAFHAAVGLVSPE